MAENDIPSLGGFDLLSDMLTGNRTDDEEFKHVVNEPPIVKPEDVKIKDDDEEEETIKDERTKESDTGDNTSDTDDTDSSSGSDDTTTDKDDDVSIEETSSEDVSDAGLGEYEEEITAFLNEKLTEEIGWNLPEDETPKNVGELVELMKNVVQEASEPVYANDEVKAFDEFVKNGGDLRDFYSKAVENRVKLETVDVENTFDQKRILKEHYANQGYKEEFINKTVKRFEDAGILEDQAADALELLKDYNEKSKKELLDSQKKNAEAAELQQQKFVDTVQDNIKELDSILGFKLSTKDKKELEESILTVDAEGYTPYQRKYMSDINELLKSAFITMKGDAFGKKIKKKGESDAVKNLHDKIKANKGDKNKKSGTPSTGELSSGLSLLSSLIQKS